MKKILFAKGNSQYNTLRIYTDLFIEGLRELGYEVNIIDRAVEGEWENLPNIVDDSYDAIMSFQVLAFKARVILEKSNSIPKGVKFISLCGDHPMHINYWLKKLVNCNDSFLIVSDVNQYNYLKKYYPWVKSILHDYTIGLNLVNEKKYTERTIDVFFGGTYYDVDCELEAINNFTPMNKKIAREIIDEILNNEGMTLEDATEKITLQNNLSLSKEEFIDYMETLVPVDTYIRGYYRNLYIQAIIDAGITIHILGNGWDKSKFYNVKNAIIESGDTSMEAGIEFMKNSKMILNIMPWSRIGLHDRIITTMSLGAICLTNGNSIVDKHFVNGKELLAFDLHDVNKLGREAKYLLEHEAVAVEISKAATNKAYEKFKVIDFCKVIMEKIDVYLENN